LSQVPPLRYRARFRLSIGDGMAIEETQGAYVSVEEHEQLLNENMAEALRLMRMATQRYPLALTETQCRDAHRWLTKHT